MKLLLWCLLLAGIAFGAEDVTGVWTGTLDLTMPDGERIPSQVYIVFDRRGEQITGTAGPSETKQWPMSNARISADGVSFEAGLPGHVLRFNLRLIESHLKGDAQGEGGMKAALDTTRRLRL
jgi:hypothetical protein